MIFSSLFFLFRFLPLVILLACFVPKWVAAFVRWVQTLTPEAAGFWMQNLTLFLASLLFYAWGEPVYVCLMLLSILFNYLIGLDLEHTAQKERRWKLVFAVVVNLMLCFFFKYEAFLARSVNAVLHLDLPVLELSLPIGISFYTFQALSYVVDVAKGKVRAQRSLLKFGLYISMFPQLIAGPIVQYSSIEEQLSHRTMTWEKAEAGLERFLTGLAKKVLLANQLGTLYKAAQAVPDRSVVMAWLGLAAFTLQLYYDFSGYSDMAIGMGKMLGFTFPENFRYPYSARSVTDFWHRWHISLSTWFRDYVYFPLGGSRVSTPKHIRNLLVVWMLTGLWHGASWNFVLWGLYYGLLLILEKFFLHEHLSKLPDRAQHLYTMMIVALGWVLFSHDALGDALQYYGTMIGIGSCGLINATTFYLLCEYFLLLVVGLWCASSKARRWFSGLRNRNTYAAIGIQTLLLILCVAALVNSSYNPFLYFRF